MLAQRTEPFRVVAESEFFADAALDWTEQPSRERGKARLPRWIALTALLSFAAALGAVLVADPAPRTRHRRSSQTARSATVGKRWTHLRTLHGQTDTSPVQRAVEASQRLSSRAVEAGRHGWVGGGARASHGRPADWGHSPLLRGDAMRASVERFKASRRRLDPASAGHGAQPVREHSLVEGAHEAVAIQNGPRAGVATSEPASARRAVEFGFER